MLLLDELFTEWLLLVVRGPLHEGTVANTTLPIP